MSKSAYITIGDLNVELVRKRIKNLNLSVRGAEGPVRVSAPLRVSEAEVRQFVASRMAWIQHHQARLTRLPAVSELRYVAGEQHDFMGVPYQLQVHDAKGAQQKVQLNGEQVLHLFVRPDSQPAQRQALLEGWYRAQLKQRIPPLIAKYEPRMGVQVAEWRIRKMKTRWGTCNIPKRRIWINLELAKLAPDCLEHIVVHEMVHLLERGHNARFYGFMDQFLPDWRTAREQLRASRLR
jgi:predicted metal-dependent hydrolase